MQFFMFHVNFLEQICTRILTRRSLRIYESTSSSASDGGLLNICTYIDSHAKLLDMLDVQIGGSILKICNVLGVWLCYAAVENQKEIMDILQLKEVNEAYGKELASYEGDNARLSKKLKELHRTATQLEEYQDTLKVLHSTSNDNADKLFQQVKKNEEILQANKVSMSVEVKFLHV